MRFARVIEIAKAPPGASKLFDKVLKRAKDDRGVDNPYAVAWHAVKRQYYKDPKTGRWKKRKEPTSTPPVYSRAANRQRELYLAALRRKEAAAATSLAQLFRGTPVPAEWIVWRVLRQRRAAAAASGLFESTRWTLPRS